MPSASGCVLMDLRRMDRIVDFSEELGYVTVEPGVTQAQLYAFLQDRGSKLWMDATGASPIAA
jgi:4-cresol dehydrogenase (hydroxylating)